MVAVRTPCVSNGNACQLEVVFTQSGRFAGGRASERQRRSPRTSQFERLSGHASSPLPPTRPLIGIMVGILHLSLANPGVIEVPGCIGVSEDVRRNWFIVVRTIEFHDGHVGEFQPATYDVALGVLLPDRKKPAGNRDDAECLLADSPSILDGEEVH